MLVPLSTSGSIVALNDYWDAIYLYYERPHIINRKVSGFILAYVYKINYNSKSNKLSDILNYISLTYETKRCDELNKTTLKSLVRNLLEPYDKQVEIDETTLNEVKTDYSSTFIIIRILIPSNARCKKCVELITINKAVNAITFLAGTEKDKYNLIATPFPYTFEYTKTGHVKLIINIDDADTASAEWLCDKLFPKILKWAVENDPGIVQQSSLALIDIERYCVLYAELKAKYGPKMIKIWPENTDPLKFVYEDVAIATYLIALWEAHPGENPPKFVDLGCGNGLLTYILTEEGFKGRGLDIRRRKIWDLYPSYVQLEETVIIPSESFIFPDVDWIIGNHSDELTPWIPVIALRSSQKTNFFVLPCCSYDFNGKKYIRQSINKSQYQDYLEYVEMISKTCGFCVEIDKLRIPSTKRTALVGLNKMQDNIVYENAIKRINDFIITKCGANNEESVWVKDFQPRESVEKVRNCTQLDWYLKQRIIMQVVSKLLSETSNMQNYEGNVWNAGGSIHFSELIKSINANDLKMLKNECGGLQTLLRNHRYIFEIANACVKLRVPLIYVNEKKYKEKPCWFLKNHPNGCLNNVDTCAYNHLY